jgi:para-aminobenzoate synthetase component I
MVSTVGRAAYCNSVSRIVEYIRAGDVFQANLTHLLRGPFRGSARRLFSQWAASAEPHHGAYLELPAGGPRGAIPSRAIVSMSPELFLDFDPATRRVVTRPMKGTSSARLDPALLVDSTKDQAELNMIVDLMRNDLGRVCAFGSVTVDEERVIEQHGGTATIASNGASGVHQGVATVSGRLAPGFDLGDLFRATFSPGSVTGAPKIRAMQIIEELEPTQRGPYCGAIGFVSDTGHARFNVAIRTAVIAGNATDRSEKPENDGHDTSAITAHTFTDATLTYGVGAGIVADSIPEKEWEETLTKAGILQAVAASVERS